MDNEEVRQEQDNPSPVNIDCRDAVQRIVREHLFTALRMMGTIDVYLRNAAFPYSPGIWVEYLTLLLSFLYCLLEEGVESGEVFDAAWEKGMYRWEALDALYPRVFRLSLPKEMIEGYEDEDYEDDEEEEEREDDELEEE